MDQDGLPVRISIDRVTRMPRGPGDTTRPARRDSALSEQSDSIPGTEANTPEKFVIDRLVAHRDSPTSMEYRFRWYGYTPADDTYELAEGLPQDFINRY